MPDFADIASEYEKIKKTPDAIDFAPVKKNKAGGVSADHAHNIKQILPPMQEEMKKREQLTAMFNTTSRAGAGGTKVGVPGIRPSGGKAASQFLEDFVGTGRIKKEPKPFHENTVFAPTRQADTKRPSVVLYEKCMDCLKPVNRDDAVPSMVVVPPPDRIAPQVKQRWDSLNLKVGDVVCYLFCGPCVRGAVDTMKDRTLNSITLIQNGQETTMAQIKMRERSTRISDQVHQVLLNERNNPYSDVFYGDAKNYV